jgi:hypothetical protein
MTATASSLPEAQFSVIIKLAASNQFQLSDATEFVRTRDLGVLVPVSSAANGLVV